jgi:hypothetical protein
MAGSDDLAILERRSEIGGQLRGAIALGDVGCDSAARHCADAGQPRVNPPSASAIHRLITTFDFDGLHALVDSLET